MATVVGIGYKKQQGKDTLADFIQEYNSSKQVFRQCIKASFATPLKRFCMDVFGLSWQQCHGTDIQKETTARGVCGSNFKTHREKHGLEGTWDELTARQVLQYVGVEMREYYPGIWVDALFRNYKGYGDDVLILIPDVRFPDELRAIKDRGGKTICLMRNDHSDDEHTSENAVKPDEFDEIVPNYGSLMDLRKEGYGLLSRLKTEFLA